MTDAPLPSADLDPHLAHDVTSVRAQQSIGCVQVNADPGRIRIGYTTNVLIAPAVGALRQTHPRAEIVLRRLDWWEPHLALLQHRVDVAVARLPFPTDGLDVTVMYVEPRVLVVPSGHHLAGRRSVSLDDFVGEPCAACPDPTGWASFGVPWTRRAAIARPRPANSPEPPQGKQPGTVSSWSQPVTRS
jgi:DNA-binding transcriptional LysR family regulator